MAKATLPQVPARPVRNGEKAPGTALGDGTSQVANRKVEDIALTGHLAGIDDEGRLLFLADGAAAAISVAIGVMIPEHELVQAAWVGKRALVLQTSTGAAASVLIALVRERVSLDARKAPPGGVNVSVEGDTVRITAAGQLELRCGKARVLLRQDGRIETSGTHLVSRSRGPIKIKGATVELN